MSTSTLINKAQTNSCGDVAVVDLLKRKVYDDTVKTMQGLDRRPKYRLNQCLEPEQCSTVRGAYPEFQIEFTGASNTSHAMAAGLRGLELEYLYTLVPYGAVSYDIGGNFPAHMMKGRSYVHCCNPALDARDLARNENYRISIENYLSRFEDKSGDYCQWQRKKPKVSKPLPRYQKACFDRYNEDPEHVTCSETFEKCRISPPAERDDIYATSLHSLYDIPYQNLGPALARKRIKVLHAAFHFSEDLLLGASEGLLTQIGGTFQRNGDVLTFSFLDESSLIYTHSFRNVFEYVTRTFFVACNRYAYMKEFRSRRVDTVFCSFIRIDTYCLYRSVFKDCDEHVFAAMDDAWEFKKKRVMLEASRPIFNDVAQFNVYFPNAKDKVCLPIFAVKSVSGAPVTTRHILVEKDFYWTALNHILTYPDGKADFRGVMSFLESIRSRVVINGTTTASQWEVDKSQLKDIALSLLLIAKLEKLKISVIEKRIKIERQGLVSLLKEFLHGLLDEYTQTMAEWVVERGWVKSVDQVLQVTIPDLVLNFRDHFRCEFRTSANVSEVNVSEHLVATNEYYAKVSDLVDRNPTLAFDFEKFQDYCEKLGVDIDTVTELIDAISTGRAGITLGHTDDKEEQLARTLAGSSSYLEEEPSDDLVCLSDKAIVNRSTILGELKNNVVIFEGTLPKNSVFVSAPDDPSVTIELSELHGRPVSDFLSMQKPVNIVYTGEVQICQMQNYLDYLSASLVACISNLKKYLQDQWLNPGEKFQKIGVWDNLNNKWIVVPQKKKYAWGLAADVDGNQKTVILNYDEHGMPILEKSYVRLVVSTDTYLFTVVSMLGYLRHLDQKKPTATITLVDGVPGCGKTQEILSRFDANSDLILVQGREACEMIRRRANDNVPGSATKENVRTFDSFVMNRKPGKFKTLWVDEGLMVHPGLINFCINISCVSSVYIFGDRKQIPFINRVMNFSIPDNLAKLYYDEIVSRDTTKRCPLDVTHFLNSVYEKRVMSHSNVQRSLECKMISGKAKINDYRSILAEGKLLTFTQEDKEYLLKAGFKDVNTVHEAQGETYRDVNLIRVTATPLTIVSAGSPHVTVALSRHTNRFVYYTVVPDVVMTTVQKTQCVSNFLLDMYAVAYTQK
nr:129 kDa replicase [Sunn-hemp mosaic virus]